jgi:hypothetical protein
MTDPDDRLRRMLITAVIVEMTGLAMAEIRSPVCPFCEHGPVMVLPGGQATCGTDDCQVFMWRVTDTPEQFRAKARPIRLQSRNPDGTWQDVPDEERPHLPWQE